MKKKSLLQVTMWFILLSTLGVGGGIFFLLFAVVPIEEWYVQRGWSQFTIDNVMTYYVVGWVVFGFIISFIYYFICLKKERWVISAILCVASIVLCIAGMNYFLNTGSSVVQASQGEVEEGERFTFGPYPEKEMLRELKEQGYDGVIALLSPAVVIEKPLLDKEIDAGKEVGIDILSMPMMPWVGDNTETLNKIRELVETNDKRYYVHCYLGRHRVDVVKQIVNEASGEEVELLVLQATSFERGPLYYDAQDEVLIGPFPTSEEWFTRVRRGEVKEIISLLDTQGNFMEEGKNVAAEMNMQYTEMPISEQYTVDDLRKVVDYIRTLSHKVFIYDFQVNDMLKQLEALYRYDKTIHPLNEVEQIQPTALTIGATHIVGPTLTMNEQKRLQQLGVEQFVVLNEVEIRQQYKQLKEIVESGKLTYVTTAAPQQVYNILHGLIYGYNFANENDPVLLGGKGIVDTRNIMYGPIVTEEEMIKELLPIGIKQIVYIHTHATTSQQELESLKEIIARYDIDLNVFELETDYEKSAIAAINRESGANYIMAHEDVLPIVFELFEQY